MELTNDIKIKIKAEENVKSFVKLLKQNIPICCIQLVDVKNITILHYRTLLITNHLMRSHVINEYYLLWNECINYLNKIDKL